MLNQLLYPLLKRIEDRWTDKGKAIFITGNGDELYLMRCILLKIGPFAVYLHRFFRSDTDDPHDHPFSFISYMVKGEYMETRYIKSMVRKNLLFVDKIEPNRAGNLLYRKYSTIHKVTLYKEYTFGERENAPMTLVFTLRVRDNWFFYPENPEKKNINTASAAFRVQTHFKKYLNQQEDREID